MATALQDAWMQQALGLKLAGPPSADTMTAALSTRLHTVREDAARLGVLKDIAAELRTAAEAAKARDDQAAGLVDALESRIAQLSRERRLAEVQQGIEASKTAGGLGVVAFNKLRLELEAARASFDDAIDTLQVAFEALLQTADFVDDPRSSDPATLAAIANIGKTLPSFPALADRIDDTIDQMASAADPALRQQHSQAALKHISDFRRQLDAATVLTEMESSDAGNFVIHRGMVAALDKVAAALRG